MYYARRSENARRDDDLLSRKLHPVIEQARDTK
jgi:hypothetical protein